jgi:dTDP-4-amino-4,6-dideoxygalactose transaminase
VPLFDVARGLAPVRGAAIAAFDRLTRSAELTLGDDLEAFERSFAGFCGVDHCVGVSDGTTALQLGLLALDVSPEASVVTVPNTFVATAEAIAAVGARPVFVDVDPVSRCIDVRALEAAVGAEVAAAIPVHLYGQPAPMAEIMAVCESAGVPVLEDAAQAHGATLAGRRAGAWGDAGAFSFYPTKNLGGWGDGGALVCRRGEIAERVRSLRHHGCEPGDPNRHVRRGATARLDNLQAALLALRLERLDYENAERRTAATIYRGLLSDLPVRLPPPDPPGASQVFHLFVVEVAERDRVAAALRANGITTGVHYPTPIHLQPAWRSLGYAPGDFPVAERLAQTCLSLPCFPGVTERQLIRVSEALRAALR